MRKRLILAAFALLILATWAAPALAQGCYGENYGYGGYGATYYTTGPVYGGPLTAVGSRIAYRATHPFAGLRGRFAARRALAPPWVAGAACYSDGYGGGCYGGGYGAGYAPYYAAPVAPAHYHVAPMAYASSYAPVSYAAPSYAAPVPYQPVTPTACPPGYHWGGFTQSCVPDMRPRTAPSPQVPHTGAGTHPCPCGDAACNHTLGSCPCTDAGCRCHLPGPGTKVQRP